MFEDRNDVEEWLDGLDYERFWLEAALFRLDLPACRTVCDEQIESGQVDRALVLSGLKAFARLELVERYVLRPRRPIVGRRDH